MEYGGITRGEMEVTIRLDRESQLAHICSTWPEWSRRPERRYGPPTKHTERDGKVTSAFWTIPLALVSLRRTVRRGRVLSEAERAARAERLKRLRRSVPPGMAVFPQQDDVDVVADEVHV